MFQCKFVHAGKKTSEQFYTDFKHWMKIHLHRLCYLLKIQGTVCEFHPMLKDSSKLFRLKCCKFQIQCCDLP